MAKKIREFSCPKCGKVYSVRPPDDNHPRMSLEHPKDEAEGTVIEMTVDCEKCLQPTKLYWYRQKMHIGVL